MTPLGRYASLLRSLPDKVIAHPKQPVLVSLSEHLGAPPGISVDAAGFLAWASTQGLISATVQWKLREVFRGWEANPPKRTQVAELMEWLNSEIPERKPV